MVRKIGYMFLALAFACCRQDSKPALTKPWPLDRGVRITGKNFNGTAYLNMLVDADSVYYTSMGNVSFEPGARTNWHSHPGGQILLITAGKGYYQEKDQPKRVIRAGEIVKCPPNILHWHGATPTDSMVHIAIGVNLRNGSVSWKEAVSDSVYKN